MARPSDLAKVGTEAFALLEECVGRKSRPPIGYSHHIPQHHIPYQPQFVAPPREAELDCYEAAQIYGGVLIADYRAFCSGLSQQCGDTGVTVFEVTKFGAKGDGKTNDAASFTNAWNRANEAQGAAKVLIPEGNYLVGPVVFQRPKKSSSPTTVEVQGTVKASTDMSKFANCGWFIIEDVDGLIITGEGSLDGQGQKNWKLPKPCGSENDCTSLPPEVNVAIYVCDFGDFRAECQVEQCEECSGPGDSKSTVRIYLSDSKSINVINSNITTGDDCISMMEGLTNVSISGITCGPAHGLSLGMYPDEQEVRGIVVDNCKIVATTNGVRIKTCPESTQNAASDITFKNLVMDRVQNLIIIDQQYGGKKGSGKATMAIAKSIGIKAAILLGLLFLSYGVEARKPQGGRSKFGRAGPAVGATPAGPATGAAPVEPAGGAAPAGPAAGAAPVDPADGAASAGPGTRVVTPVAGGGNLATATPFDIMQHGAKGDGKTDDQPAFSAAWRAACQAGGAAKVVIPKGTFLVAPIVLQGPCTSNPIFVEVLGNVTAPTDLSLFSTPEWILFDHVDDLILTGDGSFHGQGQSVWDKSAGSGKAPSNIKFTKVNNGVIEKVTSIDSKGFHFFITNCDTIDIHNIKIIAPGLSANTDGIHLSHANGVTITSSNIATGDDCIGMIQGVTNAKISDVTCGPGHGISVGSLGKYQNEQDVKGVTVDNCKFVGTTNGVRIKTWPGSPPSAASDIFFQNLVMDRVKNPIIIDQLYNQRDKSSQAKPSNVKIGGVHYKNITGTTVSETPMIFICSATNPCEVELADINFSYVGIKPDLPFVSSCSNTKHTIVGDIIPPACPA
ncbi:Glycoside hydrolase, family 28 [Dillenia turbinata]|uniref:Glycoside hydrolase, family 28 n=1 Tax=Dillenia turbinata TaxID=194707 RepID=A0AAN8ZKA6_9MAGN